MSRKAYPFVALLAAAALLFLPVSANAANKLAGESTVAGVKVGGLTYQKAAQTLENEVNDWQSKEPLKAESLEEEILIPREWFEFELKKTMEELNEKSLRPWYLSLLKNKTVHMDLYVKFKPDETELAEWPDYVDKEAVGAAALERAKKLSEEPVDLIYTKEAQAALEPVAEVQFPVLAMDGDDLSVDRLAEELDGKKVPAGGYFSFIDQVLLPVEQDTFKEQADFVASALYALAMGTNLDIVERHAQKKIPEYSEAGIDAMVSEEGEKDLILFNPNEYPYTIETDMQGDSLHMTFLSVPKRTMYEYRMENRQDVEAGVIHRLSADLPPGATAQEESGSPGVKVEVYRAKMVDGEELDTELISKDYYPPEPAVMLVSSKEMPEPETVPESDMNQLLQEYLTPDVNDGSSPGYGTPSTPQTPGINSNGGQGYGNNGSSNPSAGGGNSQSRTPSPGTSSNSPSGNLQDLSDEQLKALLQAYCARTTDEAVKQQCSQVLNGGSIQNGNTAPSPGLNGKPGNSQQPGNNSPNPPVDKGGKPIDR